VAVTVCAPEGMAHKKQRIARAVHTANIRIFIVPP
jgi:hypothetical protein